MAQLLQSNINIIVIRRQNNLFDFFLYLTGSLFEDGRQEIKLNLNFLLCSLPSNRPFHYKIIQVQNDLWLLHHHRTSM